MQFVEDLFAPFLLPLLQQFSFEKCLYVLIRDLRYVQAISKWCGLTSQSICNFLAYDVAASRHIANYSLDIVRLAQHYRFNGNIQNHVPPAPPAFNDVTSLKKSVKTIDNCFCFVFIIGVTASKIACDSDSSQRKR